MENTTTSHEIGLSMGSNLGDRLAVLRAALGALHAYVHIVRVSGIYESKAQGIADQPNFLNAVVLGTTTLDPMGLLYTVKNIEIELGRRPTFHYGPRVLDIDILYYDRLILRSPELTVPHPRIGERTFVVRPLLEVAPDWRHPLSGETTQDMLNGLVGSDEATLVGDRL